MGFKKNQTPKQTVELTKKELIDIVKETVTQQLSAYDKKQKRARAASVISRVFRLLIISAVMAVIAHIFPLLSSNEEIDETVEDDETISV